MVNKDPLMALERILAVMLPLKYEEEKQRLAKVLFTLATSLALGAGVGMLGVLFIFQEKLINSLAVGGLILTASLIFIMIRRGWVRTASFLLLTVLWLLVTWLVVLTGGMLSLDILSYVTLVALAGLLLGRRGMYISGGVTLLTGLILMALHDMDYGLVERFAFPPQTGWLLLLINLVVLIPAIDITLKSLLDSLEQARQNLAAQKQVEAELRLSQDIFYKAFHASPMAILIQRSSDRHYIDVNEAFTRITGYSREEAMGKTPADLQLFPDRDQNLMMREQYMQTGNLRDFELIFRRKDGELRYGLAWGESLEIRGEAGIIAGTIDITERKQLELLLSEQKQEVSTLYKALASITGAPVNLHALARQIADILVQDFQVGGSGLWLLSDDGTQIVRYACSGTQASEEALTYPLTQRGLITKAVTSGEVIYVPDVSCDPSYLKYREETRSEFVLPLVANGEVLGVINLESHQLDGFGERTRQLILAFAENAALAVQNARLVASLKKNVTDLQESQERISFFLRHTSEGVYRMDYDPPIPIDLPFEEQYWLKTTLGKVGECNDAFARMYGYSSREEMLGVSSRELFGDQDLASNIEANLEFFRRGYRVDNIESEEVNVAGGKVYFLNNAVGILREGHFVATWGAQREITSLKLLLAELERLNQELEGRVQQRTSELQASNRELETFSYSVSHDLRAPLRAIQGYSTLLASDYGSRLEGDGAQFLAYLVSSAQEMNEKIEGLLRFSRVLNRELQLQPVDLSQVALDVVEMLRAGEPARSVAVDIAPGMTAQGDPVLLRTVLENLLGNAWKYSARNPQAHIEFGCEPQEARQVYLVRDNGVGFDMAYASKLFGAFQRLHPSEEFEGHGIGLATVKRIIQRHQGRIWAQAKPGEGATFYFTLGE